MMFGVVSFGSKIGRRVKNRPQQNCVLKVDSEFIVGRVINANENTKNNTVKLSSI